jgi:cell division protein FtsB
MLEKIKKYQKHPFVEQLRDVRMVGLLVFAVIVLLVTWSSVTVIQTNYTLQKEIARLEEQNEVKHLENENRKLRNEYYKTDQFLELQTRQQFGKAAPGETLVVISKEAALARVTQPPKQEETNTQKPAKPLYQQNFESWMNFFFRKEA